MNWLRWYRNHKETTITNEKNTKMRSSGCKSCMTKENNGLLAGHGSFILQVNDATNDK